MDKENLYRKMLDKAISEPGYISESFRVFHNYSLTNCLTIGFTCALRGLPLGPASGYKKWLELGRQVKRGEKAIEIWYPIIKQECKDCGNTGYKKVCESCGSKNTRQYLSGFVLKPGVFVIAQTEGKEIEFDDIPELDINKAIDKLGLTLVPFSHINGNVQGYALPDKKELAVNPVCPTPVRTLIHEIAHCLMHDKNQEDTRKLNRTIEEVEAESTTYLILELLGKDSSESRGYIQNWMKDNFSYDDNTAKRIIVTANKILNASKGK